MKGSGALACCELKLPEGRASGRVLIQV